MLIDTPFHPPNSFKAPFSIFKRGLLIYLTSTSLTVENLKIRHCLIDQATAILKSGRCLIDQAATKVKSGGYLIDQAAARFRTPVCEKSILY